MHLRNKNANAAIAEKANEVFLDHRTMGSPMIAVWGPSAFETGEDITASYKLLRSLRDKGIRAHAWA